jgi:dTDP-4-amino-4,6-dideoxygalactose transaminase
MIPLVKPNIPPRELLIPELEEVIYSGYIAQGDKVEEFESVFSKYISQGYSLSVNSGTSALHIALILSGVGPGDVVISTPLTAEPTNVAIKMTGAKIRWSDIDPDTGCISPQYVESLIDGSTKSIMAVDYAGIPVDIQQLQIIEDKYNVPVIEDAAHALGAEYLGKKIGNHFKYVIFSFQAIKHITTGDGGVLHLKDLSQYEMGKLIRWFGLDKTKSRLENNIKVQGYKYHMNNINAIFGIVQLQFIEEIITKHIENGKYFDSNLKNIAGVDLLKYYKDSQPSYWLYTMKVEDRQGFISKMKENGIIVGELHKRNDLHDFLNDFDAELPALDDFYKKIVHIPSGWWVTEEDREFIVEKIKEGW